jgi:hypothetical protein
MKKLISLILVFCFVTNSALATCDFSTGITPGPNDNFTYSRECHIAVGQLVEDGKAKDAQIADLSKAIQLKDLAIQASDQRTQLWIDTTGKLQNTLNSVNSMSNTNELLMFGLGALTVFGAGFMAAKLIGK